jgi:hypothetical protein
MTIRGPVLRTGVAPSVLPQGDEERRARVSRNVIRQPKEPSVSLGCITGREGYSDLVYPARLGGPPRRLIAVGKGFQEPPGTRTLRNGVCAWERLVRLRPTRPSSWTESGETLNAHFSVVTEAENLAVYLEGRGGRRGAPNYRNPDYAQALWYILSRLASLDANFLDGTVESTETVALPHGDKVLRLDEAYPIALAGQDPEHLRLQIQRAQRPIGRKPGAGSGGNNTKRIRLLVGVNGLSADQLHAVLASGASDPIREAVAAVEAIAGRRRGQGFATDVRAKIATEERAMLVARLALTSEGWPTVEDVSRRESYDFRCQRSGEERRVEVKGSTRDEGRIFVTPKEVAHARERGDVWLAVVSGIVLDREADGSLTARGGDLTWYRPWTIDEGVLMEIGYEWVPTKH